MLLQSKKEHVIHGGMTSSDVFFYFTTPAWMMFNCKSSPSFLAASADPDADLVSGLSTSATLVLFEGSPLYDPSLLWRMAEDLGVTIFGTSAKYLDVLSRKGYSPGEKHGLSKLRQVLSTGSPLKAELFEWVYRHVKSDVLLGSITGGESPSCLRSVAVLTFELQGPTSARSLRATTPASPSGRARSSA